MPSLSLRSRSASTPAWRLSGASLGLCLLLLLPARLYPQAEDWKAVDGAMGRTGALLPGGVYKYGMPRSDLRVRVGAVTLLPGFALGSWIAFKREGPQASVMAMGDLVLLQSEIAPVMQRLQSLGVFPTALHNHVLNESPHVMYMHVEAHGDPVDIARAIHSALALTGTPPQAPSRMAASPMLLDTALIASRLGYHGKASGSVLQLSVPRLELIRSGGMEIPPAMGVATAINFQPVAGGRAAVTGDFVLAAEEVTPVIKALTAGGIVVTALHSHLLAEQPRVLFLHFWGVGDPGKLADGLRAALVQMKVAPPTP